MPAMNVFTAQASKLQVDQNGGSLRFLARWFANHPFAYLVAVFDQGAPRVTYRGTFVGSTHDWQSKEVREPTTASMLGTDANKQASKMRNEFDSIQRVPGRC